MGVRVHSKVEMSAAELKAANSRMLSSMERRRNRHFLMPREIPVDLIQIRILFNRLIEQRKQEEPDWQDQDCVSVHSFERCFQRLFFLLDDPDGFVAARYKDPRLTNASWGDFFHVHNEKKPKIKLSICERIWFTFDGSETSILAQIVSMVVLGTIILSSASFILGTLPSCQRQDPPRSAPEPVPAFETIETTCLILFTVEYVVRLCTVWNVRADIFDADNLLEMAVGYQGTPEASKLLRLIRFVLGPANLIDLAAIIPGLIGLFVKNENGGFVVLRLIRLTRIFRAFKNPAMAEPVILISRTMTQSTKALYVLLFNLLLSILIFGSLMYLVEGQGRWNEAIQRYERPVSEEDWAESPFYSIPDTFWWAMVTATTVGYGDFYPTTGLGKAIAVTTMVFSLVVGSLPVGVVGGTFSQVWDDYKEEKKNLAAVRAQELLYITMSIQELDPSKLSNLMLIEVWDDQDGDEGLLVRPSPAKFMGEVALQLELPMDQKISKEQTLKLCGNPELVERTITGSITVKYDWDPWNGGQQLDGNTLALSDTDSSPNMPTGTLRVTLVSAKNLVNLALKHGAQSHPYCMLLCYPLGPVEGGSLQPVIWRAPTWSNANSPRWGSEHCFDYEWHMIKDRRLLNGDLDAKLPPDTKEPPSSGKGDLDELLEGLFKVTHALTSVKSDLGALAGQVERLQSDLGLKDASVSDTTSFSEMRQSTQTPALPPEEDQIAAQLGGEALLPNYVPS